MTGKPLVQKPVKKQTLAEQVAETIQELILAEQLESGQALPTEPELAEQFGVSRAVVRDATRLLMARGLVEVQHGRGVFVTRPENQAFGEALLLALRRSQATVWDVEQFEQLLLPEIAALAASHATPQELASIQEALQAYERAVLDHYRAWWGVESPPEATAGMLAAYRQMMGCLYRAAHNKLVEQLAPALLGLRSVRHWAGHPEKSPEDAAARETRHFQSLLKLLEAGEPGPAREYARQITALPPAAVQAMKETPVGEIPQIPLELD